MNSSTLNQPAVASPLARLFERLNPDRYSPATVLIGGFLAVVLIGALLLALPWAAADHRSIGLVDALFTSTSAVCVTGLIVKDTPVAFSLFGELVILVLIQIGGLGYAGSAMFFGVLVGRRIGLRERIVFQQAMNLLTMEGLIKFLRWLVIYTLAIEGVVAALLTLRFLQEMEPLRAVYAGVFHAVSAFNNAGFSIFSDNLMRYKLDWTVNLVIAVAVVLGGIGYVVFYELNRYARRKIFRIPIHVKLVLLMTPLLILAGGVGLWALEASNPKILSGLPVAEQGMVAFFHSVSSRTAGFNTIDFSLLHGASLYLLIILMIIGGSPSGTAGGIKTTTAGVIFATIWSIARGRQETTLFHRRLPFQTVASAFLVAFLAFALVTGATLLLLTVERLSFERFLPALFEVASAFGTVGLSTGDGGILSYTATFSAPGKLIVVLVMFVGRLGPLTIGMAVATKADVRYRYPEERVMIG